MNHRSLTNERLFVKEEGGGSLIGRLASRRWHNEIRDVERSRRKIEAAVLKIFARQGYHGTSMREIADAASRINSLSSHVLVAPGRRPADDNSAARRLSITSTR